MNIFSTILRGLRLPPPQPIVTARRRVPKRDQPERRQREAERVARRLERTSDDRFGLSAEQALALLGQTQSMNDNNHEYARNCKDCGGTYELAPSEMIFYQSRGLHLPVRCPACRAYRKREREDAEQGAA